MIKRLFVLLLLHSTLTSFAQEPAYTPMNLNYKFKGIRVDSLFLIPNFADTATANTQRCHTIGGSLIRTGNDFWMRNEAATAWLQNVNVGQGSSPGIEFVSKVYKKGGSDSVFYIVNPTDTNFAFRDLGGDTTSLSNRINTKIDSLKRSHDSVYFKKNGSWFFAFKDSIGGGGTDSPDRINGSATDDVDADLNTQTLKFSDGRIKSENVIWEFEDKLRINPDSVIVANKILYFTDSTGNYGEIRSSEGFTIRANVLDFLNVNKVGMNDGNLFAEVAKINNCAAIDTLFITKVGLYKVDSIAVVPTLISFPNPADFPGGSIYLINADLDYSVDFAAPKPQLADGSDVTPQGKRTSYHYVSDGTSWKLLFF